MPTSHLQSIDIALDWLTNSDVRIQDPQSIAFGGTCQGYNWEQKKYPFVYSEITGYAISAYVSAYRWTNDKHYLDLATEAADFLLRVQALANQDGEAGAIPHGYSVPELMLTRQYYSFDAAMCLQGLLDLNAIQPSEKLLDSSQSVGEWLITKMQQSDGSFLAMYDSVTNQRYHSDNNFFDDFGCLHAKHAIGLIKLSEALTDERYKLAACKVCDWVIKLQNPDGAIRANHWMQRTVSHPHCYAVEGLLYAGAMLNRKDYTQAAQKGAAWLLKVQNADGSINIEYNRPWWRMGRRIISDTFFPKKVTDATAQAVRIWITLYHQNGHQPFLAAANQAAKFLSSMQCKDISDSNLTGGFYFWENHPTMYSWATMFAMNALYALENIDRSNGYDLMLKELY